jgi:hypothetical protein
LRRNRQARGAVALTTTTRGHYSDAVGLIALSGDNRGAEDPGGPVPKGGRVATHELGHAMEYAVPGLHEAEIAFLWSRTSEGQVGERRRRANKRIDGVSTYSDEFSDAYTGKDYGDAKEVWTTAVESLFAGSPYLDEDMRRWTLGVLALL